MLRALQLAAERQDRSFELRAVTSLARLWQAGGEARQASLSSLLCKLRQLFSLGWVYCA
jgi:hypothetical protein